MRTNAKKILTFGITAILTISVIGYAYFSMRDFLRGPVVRFSAPKNGETVTSQVLEVSGTSQNLSYLKLDGRKIFTDKNGNWSEKLILAPGYNIIEADAKDRFEREVKETIYVIYQEKQD